MAVGVYVGDFLSPNGATGNQDISLPSGCPDLTAAATGSWAVVFWYSTAQGTPTSGTWYSHVAAGIGFVANGGGSLSQYAVGTNSDDAVNPSNSARIGNAGVVAQPTGTGGGVQDLAAFVSFPDATHMRLNWTTKVAGPRRVNFMVLTGCTGAKVLDSVLGGSTGIMSVTGAGFSPDLVIQATTEIPSGGTPGPHGVFGVGALNKHGQQWGAGFWTSDAVTPSITSRFQQTDASLAVVRSDVVTERVEIEAQEYSIDADGYSIYVSTNNVGATWQLVSLCLDGVSSKIGAFTTAASGTQAVDTRQGFTPKGVMLATIGQAPAAAPVANGVLSIGATDLTNHRSAVLADQDAQATTSAKSMWSNTVDLVVAASAGTTTQTITESAVSTSQVSFALSTAAGGYEVCYLVIGDTGTDTFPAKVLATANTTESDATLVPYQKHIISLSTGRIVSAFRVTSGAAPFGKFVYSDDGQTWTDMGIDIAGWSSGSIDNFVDSAGTEHLVAIWKQSGTGGGRTTGQLYVMSGSFNAGRTVVTWGTAVTLVADTLRDYPDLVAVASGTGGAACLVYTTLSGTTNRVDQFTATITAADVVSLDAGSVVGGSYGFALSTWPSIDVDPATGNVGVMWSAGSNGAGFGIRFKKGTFAAGTWTWGTEREIDNTVYSLGQSTAVCLRYSEYAAEFYGHLVGWFNTGSNYKEMLYRRDLADTTTTTHTLDSNVSTSGLGLWSGSLAIVGNGDAYVFGNTFSNQMIRYAKWTRTTTTFSALVLADEAGNAGNPCISSLYFGGKVRWLYVGGNNVPYQVKYDELTAVSMSAAHPDGVISNTGWTDQSDGSTNIWQSVDETTPDDADYIKAIL